jgi:hypothetical protein
MRKKFPFPQNWGQNFFASLLAKPAFLLLFCLFLLHPSRSKACETNSLNIEDIDITFTFQQSSSTTVDVNLNLGNAQDLFWDLLGIAGHLSLSNIEFTEGAYVEAIPDSAWATDDLNYGEMFTLFPEQSKVLMLFSRDACASISGAGIALRLRLHNATIVDGTTPKIIQMTGLVMVEVIDMRPVTASPYRDYHHVLDSVFAAQAGEYWLRGGIKVMKINHLKYYPNPTEEDFYIDFTYPENGLIQVFNLDGKEVFKTLANGKYVLYIDLPPLPRGLYMIQFTRQEGPVLRHELMLQ